MRWQDKVMVVAERVLPTQFCLVKCTSCTKLKHKEDIKELMLLKAKNFIVILDVWKGLIQFILLPTRKINLEQIVF